MKTPNISQFLRQVHKAHPNQFIIMVVDGAFTHKAKNLVILSNVALIVLQPYSPELNPAERIWRELRRNNFSNRYFSTLGVAMEQADSGMSKMKGNRASLKRLTLRPWINNILKSPYNLGFCVFRYSRELWRFPLAGWRFLFVGSGAPPPVSSEPRSPGCRSRPFADRSSAPPGKERSRWDYPIDPDGATANAPDGATPWLGPLYRARPEMAGVSVGTFVRGDGSPWKCSDYPEALAQCFGGM
jgi:transposase